MPKKPVIVSGIKPTGELHLGSYLGAVKNFVDLQNSGKYEMYIFIADLHSLTGDMLPEERRHQIMHLAAEFLAAGIDPDKTTFFIQSDITSHTDLAWIFSCVTPVSELERMTQYKDQALVKKRSVNGGLLYYPILQAADILLYHGNTVPVGQDQVQHVELTRDIAKWFNNKFDKKYFDEPKALLTEVPKVMSLLEPNKKMSKSLGDEHVINIGDAPEVIAKKLKRAVTASVGGDKAPGVANLLVLLKHFGSAEQYKKFVKAEKDQTIRYGDLKTELAEAIGNYFTEFRMRRDQLLTDGFDDLADIMLKGKAKAKVVAAKTMEEVREIVGVR